MTEDSEGMREAHRRPNFRAHHPLLIWHIGLWNNVSTEVADDGGDVRVAEMRDVRIANARSYAGALRTRIQADMKLWMDEREAEFGYTEDQDTLWTYRFPFGVFRASIRMELTAEYLTITTLLDLSAEIGLGYRHGTWPSVATILRQLAELQGDIDRSTIKGVPHVDSDDLVPLAEACFERIWTDFGAQVLEVDGEQFASMGKCFADFRGVVIGDVRSQPQKAEEESIVEESSDEEDDARPPIRLQQAFWHRENGERRHHRAEISDEEWRRRFHILWPLMTAPVNGGKLVDHEFTATIFEDSALQLTAMGATPDGVDASGYLRLYYGIYASGAGGWAIGRLVSQLCDLGTYRLAAVRELNALHEASGLLREAEIEAQRAFDLDIGGNPASEKSKDAEGDNAQPLQLALARIHAKKREADRKVTGGIAHRTEQSGYYIDRFFQVLDGLKMSTHDDFQPYGKFVRANHGATFAFIKLLNTRNRRLMLDMRSLFERMATEEGRNRSLEIVRLQSFAEFLSIGFLAPYYIGTILSHMLWENAHMPQLWWGVVFGGFVALASFFARPVREELKIVRVILYWMGILATITVLAFTPEPWAKLWIGAGFSAIFALGAVLWRPKLGVGHIVRRLTYVFATAATFVLLYYAIVQFSMDWPSIQAQLQQGFRHEETESGTKSSKKESADCSYEGDDGQHAQRDACK